ncbi:MAG: hypothetical protein KGJ79_18195 [Alphaproteobacteria bacterium]|nr:hypothetical protein [Alphaproteobacteria bacterium]MDE2113072.1 hypothetical protein [Alphaproteobacteria bacterium]MDE2493761.1 hypothetical protein [Alphaproteobacteria bacterium]
MTSKLRIRLGEVEVDYEGDEDFLKKELLGFLKTAIELYRVSNDAPRPDAAKAKPSGQHSSAHHGLSLTTGSIAAKLESKSGSKLLKAAAAHLTLVKKADSFSRQQLLEEMQSATSYYRATYSNNLTKYIKTALQKDGFLSEIAKGTYALNALARSELETTLADN